MRKVSLSFDGPSGRGRLSNNVVTLTCDAPRSPGPARGSKDGATPAGETPQRPAKPRSPMGNTGTEHPRSITALFKQALLVFTSCAEVIVSNVCETARRLKAGFSNRKPVPLRDVTSASLGALHDALPRPTFQTPQDDSKSVTTLDPRNTCLGHSLSEV